MSNPFASLPLGRRPVIGITTRTVVEGERVLDGTERDYPEAITGAGGIPVLLPLGSPDDIVGTVDAVDGLLLSGGGDVDPSRYGQRPSDDVGGIDTVRDDWELALVRRARATSLPVLGICRGCQVLNVAAGGTLIQHLPDVTAVQHLVVDSRDQISHQLSVRPGSHLASVVGDGALDVNTIHHQAVGSLGDGFRIAARAEDDIVECIEDDGGRTLGVQWHPEVLGERARQRRLFSWLVAEASAHLVDREVDADA